MCDAIRLTPFAAPLLFTSRQIRLVHVIPMMMSSFPVARSPRRPTGRDRPGRGPAPRARRPGWLRRPQSRKPSFCARDPTLRCFIRPAPPVSGSSLLPPPIRLSVREVYKRCGRRRGAFTIVHQRTPICSPAFARMPIGDLAKRVKLIRRLPKMRRLTLG